MSSSNIPPPQERFKANLLSLSNIMAKELNNARKQNIKTVSENIVELGISLIKGTPSEIIIGGFITRSFPKNKITGEITNVWDEVYNENEDFFLNNSSIVFGELSEGIVDGFKVLIENKTVSPGLMKTVWKHLVAMVKTSLHFIYIGREPICNTNSAGYNITYNKEFHPHIKLEEEAIRWKVNLMG